MTVRGQTFSALQHFSSSGKLELRLHGVHLATFFFVRHSFQPKLFKIALMH